LVGILVIVATVLFGSGAAWAGLAQQETRSERTYFDGIRTVEITSGSADVEVRAGGADRTVVGQRVGWAVRRPSVSQSLDGDTLRIAVACPTPQAVLGCQVKLDIEVPAATSVHTRSSSGRIEIHGLSGNTRVETGSGSIGLFGLSGPLWAKASSGQIIGTGLACSEVRALASSGQITFAFVRPPKAVTARLASGPLVLHLPSDGSTYRLDFSSASGRQDVDPDIIDSASTRVLDITTASGPVTVDRPTSDHK